MSIYLEVAHRLDRHIAHNEALGKVVDQNHDEQIKQDPLRCHRTGNHNDSQKVVGIQKKGRVASREDRQTGQDRTGQDRTEQGRQTDQDAEKRVQVSWCSQAGKQWKHRFTIQIFELIDQRYLGLPANHLN